MSESKPYIQLNSFLAKPEFAGNDLTYFISAGAKVNSYDALENFNIDGQLFVKRSSEKKPKWSNFAESICGKDLDELSNKSSSAVLIIRANESVIAFTFGYGRFLIETAYFVQDYGIKTALNTLDHSSLRCVDLYTLEDQAVQKRSQAARESEVSVFGIDISRDVLRAVTGSPKAGVGLKNISGGDAVFSFGVELAPVDIPALANRLLDYHANEDYKENFSWVDNIRRIKDKNLIASLDDKVVAEIKAKSHKVVVTLPEIAQWDSIYGFSFTRSKSKINPTIEAEDYLDNIEANSVTIETVKRDKLHVHDVHENEFDYPLYKCLYFEEVVGQKTCILFSGIWYEIDNTFMARINNILAKIPICDLEFPTVFTWVEDDKSKIEAEGDYNERAANNHGYNLLDKKLIKTNRTTSAIELCDLMTNDKHLVHVKHRKGGSAGLSHLFAQGGVSAEVLLGDKDFRKEARKVIRKVNAALVNSVPLDNFKSDGFEIVFLILGEDSSTIKDNLPFFSKVNLTKAYENLSQRGYKVSVCGAGVEAKPDP